MEADKRFKARILFVIAASMVAVAALTAISWRIVDGAIGAARLATRAQQVLHELAEARAATLQIELSTQSYRISGDPKQLLARDAAIDRREKLLLSIGELTADEPAQRARWMELREVTAQRLALAREIEALRKTQGRAAADAFVAASPLQETRERAQRLVGAMDDDERQRLDSRISDQQHQFRLLLMAGGSAALLWLGMLAATYALMRRQLMRTESARLRLEDSETRLAITLRCITDGVMTTDVHGRVTRMNPAAEKITRWPLSEAVGRQVDEVLRLQTESSLGPVPSPVPAVLASGEAQSCENDLMLRCRDDALCPIALTASPKREPQGQVRGVVLVFRDVSFERQARLSIEAQNRQLAERVEERTAQLQQSEAHLRSVTSNVPAMIAYVDAQQRYVYVNQQYHDRFAPDRGDIVGCTVGEVLGEARLAIAQPMIARVLEGEPQNYDWEPFPGVWQAISYVPQRDACGVVSGYYVLGSDITERKRSEERIQSLNGELAQRIRDLERTTRALRTLSAGNRTMLRARTEAELVDAMCEAIVTNGRYGMAIVWYRCHDEFRTLAPMAERRYPGGLAALRFLKVSWAHGPFSGGAAASAVRSGEIAVVADMASSPDYGPWRQHLAGQRSALACPLRVGDEVIGALAIYDTEPGVFDADEVTLLTESADDLAFGIATLRARDEQNRAREDLYRLTHFDALTGLPNEASFAEALGEAIERGRQTGTPFAALQINVDRLREVNDALGFSQGDQVLRDFASRLRSVAPGHAMVARLRGDEFAILVPGSDLPAAQAFARRVAEVLAAPFQVADIPLDVSSKTGVTLFPGHGSTPHDFFRRMDIAVHEARLRGVRQAVFDPVKNADQPDRLGMASELRRAIEGNELRLYLQPKVDMSCDRVSGAEALVRWQHPERGLLPPAEFIELAEHTGLIKPLTEWMLAAVLAQNRAWCGEGLALPIAVNLSARNLRDTDLLEQISRMLGDAALAPGLLELEITESTVMEDAEFALSVLQGLRDLGIPLYVDDFGTGYSSLSYLQRLPVDYIKIDQSFVRRMLDSRDSATIVRSTIDLVHDLDRRIVAEGIETRAHWDQLLAWGCDAAQGYFIARPMPASEFQEWRRERELRCRSAGASELPG